MMSHLKRRNGPSTRLLWTVLRFWNICGAETGSASLLRSMTSGLRIGFRRGCGLHKFFPAAERMDVSREHLDRHGIEPAAPRRHCAVTGIGDLRLDVFLGAAIEPDGVRQPWRADLPVSLPCGAVTDRTVHREQLRARGVVARLARQTQ